MTNKQFEHLGRALCLEADLERKHSAIEDAMNQLAIELCASGADNEAANTWVRKHYGDVMCSWHNPRDFLDAIRSLIDADAKKGGAR